MWTLKYKLRPIAHCCAGANNRGPAILFGGFQRDLCCENLGQGIQIR